MTAVKISVIIPVKNAESTIERTLRSVFGSTVPPGEVLVIDDGCTDGTLEIVRRCPVKIETTEAPGGVAAARNRGAELAGFPVFFFVDADVVLEPGALAAAAAAMEDSSLAVAVGLQSSRCVFRNRASIYKNLWLRYTYESRADRVSVIYSSAVAIRRDAYRDVGGFDVHYRRPNIEDSELGMRITEAGHRIEVVPSIEFLHIKRYSVPAMARTDFFRTVGMTKVQLRDRFRRIAKENYSSIPTSVLISCLAPAFSILFLARGLPWQSVAVTAAFALLLNRRWLLRLAVEEGAESLFWGSLFLFLDITAVNLGILWGLIEFFAGKRY